MPALRQHGLGVRRSFRPALGRCEGLWLRRPACPAAPATYPTKTTRRGFRRAFNQTTTSHYLVIFPDGKWMPHKFKIGETVVYRNTRRARADGSIFMIIGYLNDDSGEPIYRIKHVDKGTAESARESELVKE
jgi:hypothetical protein